MKHLVSALCLAVMTLVLACPFAQAQATAQIGGTVKDQTGAVLPGAEVSATQTGTGVARNTISNETGSYLLPNLPVGPYRVEVSLPGFRTFVQTGIVLQVNSNPVVNATLEVGQVSEQVEVQANAAMVETRSSSVGQVIENARILELPLNGRNVTDLITLAGAAVQTGTTGNRSFAGSPIINVAGGLELGVAYMLDGASHVDPYNGQSQPMPFPDALQEFKVETSGLSAQHSQGTAVNAVTKSGTNELHGDLFEFVRNDLFNARNYFATTNSTLKRNQFGGTIGGPIKKNELFFFGGYQRTTLRSDPADIRQFVPTAAMLGGDFTAFASAACNAGRQITLRAPFVNNRVDPALYSKAAVNIASKLPKSSDPCGLITYGQRTIQNDGQAVGKVDYQLSDKQSVFGRFIVSTSKIPNPFTFSQENILNVVGKGFDNSAQSYTIGDTYLVDPNTVNSFRIAALRVAVQRIGAQFFSAPDIGINAYSYLPKYTVLAVTGGFSLGGGTSTDSSFITNAYQISDDISLVRRAHQMSFGASLSQGKNYTISNNGSTGNYSFNGQTTLLGMGDFFLGYLSGLTQSAPIDLFVRQKYVGLYGQDTWKATSRLTVNYGVRWEPYLPQVFTNGRVYNFDLARFQQGIKSTVYPNAPAGLYYPGDPGFPGKSGINKQWAKFGPRTGLAWDPQGNGHTSIRASYSMNYDYIPLQWRIDSTNASPWTGGTTLLSPPGGLENPWQGIPGGNPFPVRLDQPRFAAYGNFVTSSYDLKPTVVHSWNLSVQRQVASDLLVTASYLGSHQVHVWVDRPLNNAVYIPGGPCTIAGVTYNPCSSTSNTNPRRRFSLERPQDGQFIGFVDQFDDGGTQGYHGLLVSVQRRAARGLTVNGNYTLSHCIGDNADTAGMGPNAGSGASMQDPNNRRAARGNCPGDRRQIFNLTAVAETPKFANPTLRAVATGWRLAPIYRMSSGQFLTVTSGVDRALNGISTNGRPNQALPSPYGNRSLSNFLNPAAFVQPDLGTLGNMGRSNILGPKSWQFDVALSRTFDIRESQRLELRAEAYNITNSLRMGNPTIALNSNTFGQITTSGDPRIMQFALKYVF